MERERAHGGRWRICTGPAGSHVTHPFAQVQLVVSAHWHAPLHVQVDAQLAEHVQVAVVFVSIVMVRSSCVKGVVLR